MAPEYGSTCGFSPFDQKTVRYMELTGRPQEIIDRAQAYMAANACASRLGPPTIWPTAR
ncbi:hypothetical protein CRD60_01555 [Bifidobacterium aemilianum]|uniref:Aconitase/3-isopropylmalate dehydratase large subunit alpha/beta/alpha domain-containing protein n=1 Tax=Bifidobacterium aemilianum TaxID=2493120 RepID=A0A366KBD7_9BIFI|nr:hypothetical protein CRD60_01555 [Bifidobacterium aemilianum]